MIHTSIGVPEKSDRRILMVDRKGTVPQTKNTGNIEDETLNLRLQVSTRKETKRRTGEKGLENRNHVDPKRRQVQSLI